jgi:proline racemase
MVMLCGNPPWTCGGTDDGAHPAVARDPGCDRATAHENEVRVYRVLSRPVTTADYHTAGEPFRIVESLPVPVPGSTVADRRMRAISDPDVDGLRKILCFEPRGHADMYGGFITPADDDEGDFGVLFWHKDGFSTACGHGTIALGAWAVETGRVSAPPDGVTDVVVDVPSGRVTARVHTTGGRVTAVDFVNVPSYLAGQDIDVTTSRGAVKVDVGFGGAMYAHLRAADVGLNVVPEQVNDLIAIGREVKWLLNDTSYAQHPADDRLSGIYGTILFDELGTNADGALHQRNVTIFADGELDRSPCGSGTASRLAVLAARGTLRPHQMLAHDSIIGSTFHGSVLENVNLDGRPAVIPKITGMAYRCGSSEFTVDPADPLVPGFVLR